MAGHYRIGVIAPYLDGEYYGRLLPHIQQAIREYESQLIAIQVADDYLGITALEDPVAFALVDAWILILPSASAFFIDLLGKTGKPFICVGFQSPLPNGYSISVNNRISMETAVDHLIDHGHQEIAFIGNLEQHDLHERYLGYRDALERRGIPIDERRVVMASNNIFEGGINAAEQLLDRGVPFTAVAAGTDLNALGVIDCLQSRGFTIPGDCAVVGFDDIHQAAVSYPSLTTNRQPFEQLARESVQRIFELLQGRELEKREAIVPAQLIERSSCGCAGSMQQAMEVDSDSFIQNLAELRLTLHRITSNNYKMTRGLIVATKDEAIQISKLFWNLSHWGCLALWEEGDQGQRQLVIQQAFSKNGDAVPPEGEKYALYNFPPVEYLPPGTRPGGEDIVTLHPLKSDLKDWGYIALAGPMDPLNNFIVNDLSRHSFSILAAALERQHLFHQVRSIAEKLEIVSRTTNDGIWDWDLETNRIEWNIRAHKILKSSTTNLTEDPAAFLKLVHPDDRKAVRLAFAKPYQKDQPIQMEFRIQGLDEQLLWVFLAGDVVWDEVTGLPARIIGSLTDITQKKANEAKIIQLAYHDALTGLPNRLLFKGQLQDALKERSRDKKKLAVMMIDLDRFKIVNDTLGHQTGDFLLQQISLGLKKCIGEKDVIARLGGDEFIVLLSSIEGIAEVVDAANKMLQVLTTPFLLEGQEFYLSASIGACLYPDDGMDVDSLIKYADMAMYHMKEQGGNNLEIYTPALSFRRVEKLNMENSLRNALERDEFVLNFQPQVELSTGKVYGAETLIRWNTNGRTIQPGDFIPLAEETGLIVPIGQWVLERACLECTRWMKAGLPNLVISVNISALQFQQPNFPDNVRNVLTSTGIAPSRLCLEITEHTAVQNMEHSIRMLSELVDLGVKIAIDDFGIGQSSLLWLKKLPVHIVKIDPSFILNMIEDSDDDAIAKAVIEMSHSLGLTVTAEGVETEGQLLRLQQLSCDRIQGFYTGRPMTSDQFIAYLSEITSWMDK